MTEQPDEYIFSLILYEISIWAIPAVIAITFHEASHGYVAHVLGDDTAWRLDRVSFNPLVHIDPFGTVVLPVMLLLLRAPFLFGYAKIFAHFAIRAWVRYWSRRLAQE
jgi:Zn-dependent protease